MASFRVIDRSDREMLLLVKTCANSDGIATSDAIAKALGLSANGRSPRAMIGSRLSWMVRFGQLDKVGYTQKEGSQWMLTGLGEDLLQGHVPTAVLRALQGRPGQKVTIMRELAKSGYVNSTVSEGHALRREWIYGMAQR